MWKWKGLRIATAVKINPRELVLPVSVGTAGDHRQRERSWQDMSAH